MKVNVTPVHFTPPSSTAQKKRIDDSQESSFQQTQASAAPTTAASAKSAAASSTNESLPVDAYAIPSWMSRFGLSLNGSDPAGDPKTAAFSAASASELKEYSEGLQTHLLAAYEKNGLSGLSARYNVVKTIPGLNDRLYADFKASISTDDRMLSLMSKLGVTMS